MACKPRLYFPGAFYYLLNQGNQRQRIFHDKQDYQTLMAALVLLRGRMSLRKISEVLAQGWGLEVERVAGKGGHRAMSGV